MLMKGDEDAATISALQKKIRELEAKIEELEEDLESERAAKKRVSSCQASHWVIYNLNTQAYRTIILWRITPLILPNR